MARAISTPVAEADLDDIIFYVAYVDRSPHTGDRIYHKIRSRVEERAEKLLSGLIHPDAPTGWRYFREMRWLVFYRPISDGLEVMRVLDVARDLPQQLRRIQDGES